MRNKDSTIYDQMRQAKSEKRKLLAILLDPDKIVWEFDNLISKINHLRQPMFYWRKPCRNYRIDELIIRLKQKSIC
jgi:putative glycerol-1-phosphate prenyltransferase